MPKTGEITIYRRLAKSFCIKKGAKITNKQWMPLSGWLSSSPYWLSAAYLTPSPGVAAATYLTLHSGDWITPTTTIRSVWTPGRSVPGPPSWWRTMTGSPASSPPQPAPSLQWCSSWTARPWSTRVNSWRWRCPCSSTTPPATGREAMNWSPWPVPPSRDPANESTCLGII